MIFRFPEGEKYLSLIRSVQQALEPKKPLSHEADHSPPSSAEVNSDVELSLQTTSLLGVHTDMFNITLCWVTVCSFQSITRA
jgi:hypothetical protein